MNIFPHLEGTIDDFDVIVEGHLRWNRYFGETPSSPPRGYPSTCTSVMIRGKDTTGKAYVLIVDPTTRWTPKDYYFDVNRRTGLYPEAITHCFSTHHHGDHVEGLQYFPGAVWLAGRGAAQLIRETATIEGIERIQEVCGEFLPGVYALPLPGHTDTLHGVAFCFRGKKILVAGDGIMTKYHFLHNTTEFETDAETAAQTIRNIKESFDFVIPGHDGLQIVFPD